MASKKNDSIKAQTARREAWLKRQIKSLDKTAKKLKKKSNVTVIWMW